MVNGIVEPDVAYQFVGAFAHTEIVKQPVPFQFRGRLRTDHAAIDDNANAESVDINVGSGVEAAAQRA
jgi:hypothetical protein